MPPCEPLTTTAPAASGPTRVMLSAVRIGGSAGKGPSGNGRGAHHAERGGGRTGLPQRSGSAEGLMLLVDGRGAFCGLRPVKLPLFLTSCGTLFGIEFAVVIGVDLIEALAIELVAFLGRHRGQLIIIRLAPFET